MLLKMSQIHGHEVLQMMLASGKTYTSESLIKEILGKFGPEARFQTCSAEELTAAQLVDFLDAKGKLVPQGGGFQTSPDRICQH
jgi:probable metal-binding protein